MKVNKNQTQQKTAKKMKISKVDKLPQLMACLGHKETAEKQCDCLCNSILYSPTEFFKPKLPTYGNLKSGESLFYTTPSISECQCTPLAHKLSQLPNYDMGMG